MGKLDGKVVVITGGSAGTVALFLASDDSSYVNGLELVTDGGITAI